MVVLLMYYKVVKYYRVDIDFVLVINVRVIDMWM